MNRTRLVLMAHTADAPSPYLILTPEGAVLQRGELRLDQVAVIEPMRTVVIVPGADVLVRWLDLQTRTPAQALAAAAYLLQDELAAPRDRLHIVLGGLPSDGPRMAAVVNVALLQAWMDHAEGLGLTPDVMIPDCLTLPAPDGDDAVLAVRFGPGMALRGRRLALTCDPDLAPVLAGERTITPIEDAETIERMLAHAGVHPAVNLLGSARGPRVTEGLKSWRRAAILAGVLLASPLLLLAAEATRHDLAARELNAESEAAVRAAWPDTPPGADPAAEVRRRMAAGSSGAGFSGATATLFTAIEAVEGAELDSLSMEPDGAIRATISHPDFADIDLIQAALSDAGLSLTEESTLEDDGGRIISDVVVGGQS